MIICADVGDYPEPELVAEHYQSQYSPTVEAAFPEDNQFAVASPRIFRNSEPGPHRQTREAAGIAHRERSLEVIRCRLQERVRYYRQTQREVGKRDRERSVGLDWTF
jgi:hypothetical protein